MSKRHKIVFGVLGAGGTILNLTLFCVIVQTFLRFLDYSQRFALEPLHYLQVSILAVVGAGLIAATCATAHTSFCLFRSALTGCALPKWMGEHAHGAD